MTDGTAANSSAPDTAEAVARARAALDDALFELTRLSDERDSLDRRVRELNRGLRDALAQTGELARMIADLRRQLSEQTRLAAGAARARQEATGRAELLSRTATGVREFHARLADELQQYRGQRAWRIMLFFRKAYTLAVRQGWAGRLRLAGDLLRPPRRAGDGLDQYELKFPDILSYVPHALLASPPAVEGLTNELAGVLGDGEAGSVPCGVRPRGGHDVIVLPVFEFDFRMQRPQHMAEQFALRGHRVFWVSPGRTPSSVSGKPYQILELRENVWEVHLQARHPNVYLGQLTEAVIDDYSACLRELYRDCGISASCVLVQLPFWRRVALFLRETFGTRLVYDCMDDWESMPNLSEFTRSEEARLAGECDILVVSSGRLVTKYREHGPRPLLVRNGVDFQLFSSASPAGLLSKIRKPVVGYFGAIAEWFDYDLLYEVAKARPHYSFVLVGGLGLEERVQGAEVQRLTALGNVHLLGHKPYQQIPSYLAEFDACIIPFVLNQVTHATDPVKLYEYLSQGKPVVTTAMGEMMECGDLVYVASAPAEFAEKLDAALHEPDTGKRARRIQFAAENTWAVRVDAIEGAMVASFPMVSVIIVTHNSAEYVKPCLDSILRNTSYPRWEAIVVDNNSGDDTADLVGGYAAADSRIRLIRRTANTGFAAGNNAGVLAARGEYLILLNMDTVVAPGWLERLVRHARKDQSVGMVVPVTNCAGNEVQVPVSYQNLQEMEIFALELARENMGISLDLRVGPLFCALIPRSAWEKVGELDERYEVGMFEDDDYSHRLARAGYRISTAEDCFVHHFGQGAFSKLAAERYQAVFEANRRRFEQKWGFAWIPHKYRPGVSGEGRRFTPSEFGEP